MSGIYIHIPICKSRCIYCNFYSTTAVKQKQELIDALLLELQQRQNYLPNRDIKTIYFGGGTPSTLSVDDIQQILGCIQHHFKVAANAEITLEANPDDLTPLYLSNIHAIGINRLSIGIQSFDDEVLRFINRRHTAQQAIAVVAAAQQAGFGNISIDLIYGFPKQTLSDWDATLAKALNLNVQHISAYGLTYETGTVLHKKLERKEIEIIPDDQMNQMYDLLVDKLAANNFIQYEVSNFAKPDFQSRHNSAYWTETPYLGIGPAAHSFDGHSRQWNVSSLNKYMAGVQNNRNYYDREILSETDRYNEFIMLSLRTIQGIDLTYLQNKFGKSALDFCLKQAQNNLYYNNLAIENNRLKVTKKGFYILNLITEAMFKI